MVRSHCSNGLFESSRLVLWLPSPDDVILAGSENHKNGCGPSKHKIVALLSFVMPTYN